MPQEIIIPATSISINGIAVLITGDANVGKSILALQLIEEGAILISDDVTRVEQEGETLLASPYSEMEGCIEVRGIGILKEYPVAHKVPVKVLIELGEELPERMPLEASYGEVLGVKIRQFKIWQNAKSIPTLVRIALKIANGEVFLLQDNEKNA